MNIFNSLKIGSLNCRGLNSNKLYNIKDLIIFHNLEIFVLQETHICSNKEFEEIEFFLMIINVFSLCQKIRLEA